MIALSFLAGMATMLLIIMLWAAVDAAGDADQGPF